MPHKRGKPPFTFLRGRTVNDGSMKKHYLYEQGRGVPLTSSNILKYKCVLSLDKSLKNNEEYLRD